MRGPPSSTLFPYTTLFRSVPVQPGTEHDLAGKARGQSREVRKHDLGNVLGQICVAINESNRSGINEINVTGDELPKRRRSEEHTSELQSLRHLVCRLLLEK